MNECPEKQADVQNWTDAEGIAAKLQDRLKLTDYGVEFQIWRDSLPLNEAEAKRVIIGKITTRPVVGEYLLSLRDAICRNGGEEFVDDSPEVWIRGSQPEFKHGDFKYYVNFRHSNPELRVIVGQRDVKRKIREMKSPEIKREKKTNKLQEKLEDTRTTGRDDYLAHARQCGYLTVNTTMRFFANIEGQFGTSIETHIQGISLLELQTFVDSAGRESLSGVSTHVDTSLEKDCGKSLNAMHSDFAKEIIDFLNLEFDVDIDDIKRLHREEKSNSGHQPIEHWGANQDAVLRKLLDRRPGSVPASDVTEAFGKGRESVS